MNDLTSPVNWLLLLIGGVLFVTGVSGSCPLYRVMGISTYRKRNNPLS